MHVHAGEKDLIPDYIGAESELFDDNCIKQTVAELVAGYSSVLSVFR